MQNWIQARIRRTKSKQHYFATHQFCCTKISPSILPLPLTTSVCSSSLPRSGTPKKLPQEILPISHHIFRGIQWMDNPTIWWRITCIKANILQKDFVVTINQFFFWNLHPHGEWTIIFAALCSLVQYATRVSNMLTIHVALPGIPPPKYISSLYTPNSNGSYEEWGCFMHVGSSSKTKV